MRMRGGRRQILLPRCEIDETVQSESRDGVYRSNLYHLYKTSEQAKGEQGGDECERTEMR